MPFMALPGLRVYYELRGSGPHLLYFNGSGGDLRRQPNMFDAPLATSFTLLAHDQRGLGQTERPDRPYTMAEYAADAEALLTALGWERCRVMGVSFGGMVAQEFALRYPSRVERLVLACTSSGGAGGASYPLHEVYNLAPAAHARLMIGLSDTRQGAAWQAEHPQETEELVQQRLSNAQVGQDEPGRAMGAWRQLEARSHLDTYERLPTLAMPVLICGGRYDGIAPLANQVAMYRQIPHAELARFEGGHGFLDQDPTAYPRVIAFLRGEG
jgi:3-oxoadipate enol-lactonase